MMSSELEGLLDERSLSGEDPPTCTITTRDKNAVEGSLKGFSLARYGSTVTVVIETHWIGDGLGIDTEIESCAVNFCGKQLDLCDFDIVSGDHSRDHSKFRVINRVTVSEILGPDRCLVTLEIF